MSLTEKTDIRDSDEKVVEIEMERLRTFTNHPFKVIGDSQMIELQDSIKKYGVLNPLIVRPRKEGYYEIISGHRRKYAAERLGYKKIPVIIRMMQDEVKEALGSEYTDYNLIMATTFGMPINGSYIRDQMQKVIDKEGLPDVVFHSLRHTSVTYKLKLSGGDIKAVQGDSRHAQADMVTEVYGHILDEDRRKNAELMENAFYNKENLNPQMKNQDEGNSTITVPDGVDAELLMKVLGNPEMAALLTSLARTMKVE